MFKKLSSHPLIAGSFLLTLAGLVSRLIGFFYRIYLSRTFGEEGMGIYQLITPILALSFSLTAAGFQTAVSRFVAEQTAFAQTAEEAVAKSAKPFLTSLAFCLPLSLFTALFLFLFSDPIARQLLSEPRTAPLLRLMALSVPFSSIHACINGYFYGRKKAAVPAATQILEQLCRVTSVFLLSSHSLQRGIEPPLRITAAGLFMGELVSVFAAALALFSVSVYPQKLTPYKDPVTKKAVSSSYPQNFTCKALLSMAFPLIANRVTLNILQSMETVSLPGALRSFGYDTATSLSVYGVLTGMAFPLLFFPSAFTGSIGVLLLPMISEKQAAGDTAEIRRLTQKTICYCILFGSVCMIFFLLFGRLLGSFLFHSDLAGYFITALSFICPFFYLNNTLSAIIQGIGKVLSLFWINVSALLIRLLFIYFLVPDIGIRGYLWGLLVCQIFQSIAYTGLILQRKDLHRRF